MKTTWLAIKVLRCNCLFKMWMKSPDFDNHPPSWVHVHPHNIIIIIKLHKSAPPPALWCKHHNPCKGLLCNFIGPYSAYYRPSRDSLLIGRWMTPQFLEISTYPKGNELTRFNHRGTPLWMRSPHSDNNPLGSMSTHIRELSGTRIQMHFDARDYCAISSSRNLRAMKSFRPS